MKPKKRIVKKWYSHHTKIQKERYQDYCINKLYEHFPETEKWAIDMKPFGFKPIDWYKINKRLWKE